MPFANWVGPFILRTPVQELAYTLRAAKACLRWAHANPEYRRIGLDLYLRHRKLRKELK